MGRKSSSSRSGPSQKGKSYAKLFEKMTILKSKVKTLESRKSTITNNAVSEILKHKFKVSQLEKDGRIVFVSIYIYIYADSLWLMLFSGSKPSSPTVRTRCIGVCVAPPNVLAVWCRRAGAKPAGRLMSPGMAVASYRRSSPLVRSASAATCSCCRLRGSAGCLWLWIVFFYILFLSRPTGRRTMAHRSHGHMGRQGGRGCPPLVIYIYFYNLRELL